MPRKVFGFDRQIQTVFVLTFIYTVGGGAVIFMLPLVADRIFNNFFLVGLMLGVSGAASMLSAVPFGALSNHIGRKGVLAMGLFMGVLIGFMIGYAADPLLFFLFMILVGLGNASVNTAIRSYVMDISPRGQESKYFSVYTTAMSLGFVLGPLAAGEFMSRGLDAGIYGVSLLFMAACLVSLFVSFSLEESVKGAKVFVKGFRELVMDDGFYVKSFSDFRHLGLLGLTILLVTALLSLSDRVIWTIEPLYYNSDIPAFYVGLIMSMFILPYVLFEIPAGFLADRYGKYNILLIGLFVSGFSLIAFGLSTSLESMVFFAFLSTTGFSMVWPSLSGLLTQISGKYEKGNIVGVWNFSEDVGFTLGPLLGGFVAYFFDSIGAPFLALGCLVMVSFCVALLVRKA